MLDREDFHQIENKEKFLEILHSKVDKNILEAVRKKNDYENDLIHLQAELVNLQHWIAKNKRRVCVIFEGRDAAGKGGAIRRFTEHLNPRSNRIVALTKPTDVEKGQWYFRRYIKELPEPGEIVFFFRGVTTASPNPSSCAQKLASSGINTTGSVFKS